MERFKPTIYQKSVYDIDYKKLKGKGIKCLVFDLDNTLGLLEHHVPPKKTSDLINKLKKDFIVVIISNNSKKRIKPYIESLDIDAIYWALKPSIIGLSRVKKNYHLAKEEMAIIGDQLVTDILAGTRFKITTILVDPMGKKDLKITALNRKIEEHILKKYQKRHVLERGKYYE